MIARLRTAAVLGTATALAWTATLPLLPPASGADSPGPVDARAPAVVVLDGVRVRLRAGTEQVVTVNHTRGYRARVTFWRLTDAGWTRRFDQHGR